MGTIIPLSSTPSDYTVLTTDYVGNMIYENGALKEILLPEGYYQNGTFYYYLKDHLGDNRVTINRSGAVVEKSHYYPSGTRFFTESTNNSLKPLPYRYNGKELEAMNGLNQMDYGARRRFSWGPIWTGVDPLAEDYPNLSSYVYCANNPVKFVDPDGRLVLLGGPTLNNGMKKLGALLLPLSDFNDLVVVGSAILSTFTNIKPINIDGSPADGRDIDAATKGLLLPVVSGSALRKPIK